MPQVFISPMRLSFVASGNSNISARHRTCLQTTRQTDISGRADCVIAVSAEIGSSGLPSWLKCHLSRGGRIRVSVHAAGRTDAFTCRGRRDMSFASADDLVFRRSTFVCGRTVGIESDKSAKDLNRALIGELRKEGSKVLIAVETL